MANVTGRIVVHGLSGNDKIAVSPKVTKSAWLFGDAGNDRLTGGGGNDLLVGGGGNDTLAAKAGANVLVGGRRAGRRPGAGGGGPPTCRPGSFHTGPPGRGDRLPSRCHRRP